MIPLGIVTDGGACLPTHEISRHGIEVVPFSVFVAGQRTSPDELDRLAGPSVSTAQASAGEFLQAYQRAGERAQRILSVHIARELSSSYWTAQVARQQLPGLPVRVIDSRSAATGQGLLVLAAARLAASGTPFPDLLRAVTSLRRRIRVAGTVRHPDRLRRSGRLDGALLVAAARLGLQPVFSLEGGRIRLEGAYLGAEAALEALVRDVRAHAQEAPVSVGVGHAGAPGAAVELLERVRSDLQVMHAYVAELDPVMRLRAGPGAVVLGYYAAPPGAEPLEAWEPLDVAARQPIAPALGG